MMASDEDKEVGTEIQHYGIDIRRKLKLEAHVTSGCGKHKEKIRTIDTFWDKVWPTLEAQGWTKIDGTGRQAGSILFIPKGASVESGYKGLDYYDRIRGVIDRLMERRNEFESNLADTFEKEIAARKASEKKGVKERGPSRPRRKISRDEEIPSPSSLLDLSWKEGRNFPKQSSKVGPEYQATEIPKAGTYQDKNEGSDYYCELVWDPYRAKGKGIDLDENEQIIASLPHNKKEAALLLLAKSDYDVEGFKEVVEGIKPTDGSDWSPEKKAKYHDEIFRLRKDMVSLSKSMEIPMKTCLAYYFGTFKKSDDYRLVKTVCAEERLERMAALEYGLDACAMCEDGGSLLICDGCEAEYHMTCLKPALKTVPEGYWLCDECVDRKFLAAREYLILNSPIFQKGSSKKRSIDDVDEGAESGESEKVAYRPTEPVVKAVRTLAGNIFAALSKPAPSKKAEVAAKPLSASPEVQPM